MDPAHRDTPARMLHFLADSGEMATRIRRYDWAATPLGQPESWPQTLRGALSICLHSSIPTAIYWGPDLCLLYNDAWIPIPADRHPAALGRPAHDIWTDIWNVVGPQLDEVVTTGKGLAFYHQKLPMMRGGVVRETYWNYSFTPLFHEDGSVAGVFNQGHETTVEVLHDRRREAESVRQRQQFQQAPGFITILRGPNHTYEFVNDAYRRLFGERDYIGRTTREVFPELEGQGVFELLDAVYTTGERFIARRTPITVVHRGDGESELFLDYIYEPILDDDGNVTGIFCQGVDATETERAVKALKVLNETLEERIDQRTRELSDAHEALRHAQKMEAVGQLTGGIAHDFNNLLAAIGGSLEAVDRRIAAGQLADLSRYIEGARMSVDRAALLTQRLLAFSRRQTLNPQPTDIGDLARGIEEMVRQSVGPGISVVVTSRSAQCVALIDAGQLENALLNLAVNARDAMPGGGRLSIEVSGKRLDGPLADRHNLPAGDYVTITVADTGTGMAGDVLERIFDPFFTTKPLGQGTGLGLSMVHGFMRQSDGQVHIESAPGKGTVIELLLPCHAGGLRGVSSSDAGAPAPSPPHAGLTILVVDDEPIVRMLMVELLEDAGYTVIEAHDGPSALKLVAEAAAIDLLVTDIGLPGGMDGCQLADAVREQVPGLGVLYVSGYAASLVPLNSSPGNETPVLTKPFVTEELLRHVANLLAQPADPGDPGDPQLRSW